MRHTSASLTIQENADPDVRTDLSTALRRLAPEDAGWVHTTEGPDDMPAHVKAMLTGVSLHIPVRDGALALGTWQGLYLIEHRAAPHRREVVSAVSRQRLDVNPLVARKSLRNAAGAGSSARARANLAAMPETRHHRHRLIIADDHPLFRGALREAIGGFLPDAQISRRRARSTRSRGCSTAGRNADLVLLDLSMPGVRGFSGLMYLRAQYPAVPIVVVSGNDDPSVIGRCMDFGASGFIPKTLGIDVMREAIRRVLDGEIWTPPDVVPQRKADRETDDVIARLGTLTPQQVRVLMMLAEGLLNKQIAHELSVSEATVKAHVSAILQKLRVDSRTQAVIALAKIETHAVDAAGRADLFAPRRD